MLSLMPKKDNSHEKLSESFYRKLDLIFILINLTVEVQVTALLSDMVSPICSAYGIFGILSFCVFLLNADDNIFRYAPLQIG